MQFGMGPGDGFRIFQTNFEEDIEITDEVRQLNGEQWFDSTGRASLAMTGNNCHESYRDTFTPLTAAFYDSGILLVACVYKRGSEHYINFRIHIPRSPYHQSGRIRGFFGDYDSNPTNEFYKMDKNIAEVDNFGRDGIELFNLLKTCKSDRNSGRGGPFQTSNFSIVSHFQSHIPKTHLAST